MKTQTLLCAIGCLLCATFVDPIDSAKVKLDVYYETLCPDSIGFLIRKLIPKYDSLSSIMELNLIPFGKAEIYEFKDTLDFYCQHGPKECRGNTIQGCAINQYKQNYTKVLPFIECMSHNLYGKSKPNVDQIANQCASEEKLNWDKIEKCASNEEGKKLLQEAGKKTKSLRPKLTFVPTIVLNEKYSESNQNKALYGDISSLICENYTDSPKPKVCSSDSQ